MGSPTVFGLGLGILSLLIRLWQLCNALILSQPAASCSCNLRDGRGLAFL